MQVKNTFGCKFLSVFLCLSMLLAPVVTLADTMLTAETESPAMTVDNAVTVRDEVTLDTPIFRLVEDVDEITGDVTYVFASSGKVGDVPNILKYSSALSADTTAEGIYEIPVDIKKGDKVIPAGTYVAAPSAEEAYEWYVRNTAPSFIIKGDDLKEYSWNSGGITVTVAPNKAYATYAKTDTTKNPESLRFDFNFRFKDMGITADDCFILVKYRTTSEWTTGYTYAPVCCESDRDNFAMINDGAWHDRIVDASNNPHWPSGKNGTSSILSFAASKMGGIAQNASFDIAYIAFFKSEAEAKLYGENNPAPDKLYTGSLLTTAAHEANRIDIADNGAFVKYTVNSTYKEDPYMHLMPASDVALPAEGSGIKTYMSIKYRTKASVTKASMLFSWANGFSARQVDWNWVNDGKWNTVTIDITSAKRSAAADIAAGSNDWLRFDFFNTVGDDKTGLSVDIAYIAFFNAESDAVANTYSDSVVVPERLYTGSSLIATDNDSLVRVKFTQTNNYVNYLTKSPDPYAHLSPCADMPLDKSIVAIKYRTSSLNSKQGIIHFGNASPWPSVTWKWNNDGKWNVVIVDATEARSNEVSKSKPWFRFDIVDYGANVGQSVDVAYIAFFGSVSEAIAYSGDCSYSIESVAADNAYIAGDSDGNISISSSDRGCVAPKNDATSLIGDNKKTMTYDGETLYMYKKIAGVGDTIPEVKAWLVNDWGSVAVGVKGVSTGAYLKVWSGDNVFDVPVTTDMLYDKDGNTVSTATAGEQTGLVVKYLGVEIYKDFTLNVVAAKDFIKSSNGIFKLVDPIDPYGNVTETLKPSTQYMLVNDSESGYAKVLSLQFSMASGEACGVVPRSSYVHEIEVDGEKQYYVVPVGGVRDVWTTEFPTQTYTSASGAQHQAHPNVDSLGGFFGPFYYLKSSSNTYLRYNGTGIATDTLQNLNAGWLPSSSTLYAQTLDITDSGFLWCEMPQTTFSLTATKNTVAGTATVLKGSGLACFGTTIGLKIGGANDTGIADGSEYQEWRGLHYANEINNFTTRNPVDGYITPNANMTTYDRVFYYEKDTTVTKMTIYVDKTDVAVGYGAAGADITGANLVITTHKVDGTFSVSRVPVTMDMLSTSGSSGKTAVSTTSSPDDTITFKNVEVTYQDAGVGTLDTLTVTAEEKGKPTYPNPGSVIITKELDTATHNYNATGTARLELSVTGVPVSSGADVVIAIDNSGSMDSVKLSDGRTRRQAAQEALKQALTSFASSGKDIAVSVVTFDGYDLIDAGYVVNASRYNITADGKLDTSTYRVDTNCDSNLESDTAQFLAAGFSALIPHVNDRFVEPGELTTNKINSIASNYVNAGGGTNYDRGLELAYETLNARQKQNALEGKKRDSYLILMGDGDTLQYNYLGISGNSSVDAGRNQAMLKGELDDNGDGATYIKDIYGASSYASNGYNVDHTGATFSSLPTHPYYDTHYNKYGASWMAEAIKGDTDKKYMVIDPDADPKDEYLTYVNGLGATVYTVGFGVLNDNQISNMNNLMKDKKATGYVTGEVLRKISSDFDLENAKSVVSNGIIKNDESVIYSDNQYTYFTVTDIGGVFKTIADKIAVAGNATFTDAMSEYVDLQMKKATEDDVAPVIYVTEYETYKYSEIDTVVDGVYVTAELVGKVKKGYENGKVIEEVTFSADGTSAESNKLTGNIISSNKINASTFTYDMSAEKFTWNVGFIPENKLVLSFDIYLTGSLEGTRGRGTYITNNDNGNVYGAKLTYTDIEGKSASEQVATPTIPWGGSQVSYGFYLVDENGNPITTVGGKPVAFDLAYKVKDKAIYEEFNNNDSATVDPKPVLPSGFALYDPSATYTVTSNEDGTGGWTITKDSGISRNTTYVTQFSSGGITSSNELEEDNSEYSYANTVVWFAVVLSDEIRGGESVVIDYGLPVDINVVADNKAHYDKVVALAKSAVNGNYSDELDEAFYNKGADGTITNVKSADGKFGTAAITSDTNITYTPKKTMEMYDVDVFTYAVERKSGETMFQKYAYETLTVIPAANIYYEDAFVDFATYKNEKDENGDKVSTENAWKDVTDINGTEGSADLSKNPQNQDRPGAAIQEIGNDADNVYGFDSRYENYATFSLGSAKKITVDGSIFGEAKFTFKGTGFDIISLTSNTTGAIVVQVKGTDANNKDVDRNFLVDTYYGYSYEQNEETKKWEWVVNKNSTDALYQIPVIKVDDLTYGTYEVTVLVSHISSIDKTKADGYEFYFDAVRIYDPAGIYDGVTSNNNQTIENAYKDDNEAWPEYTELRDVINEANTIQSSVNKDGSTLAGSMFIDGCPTIANADSDNNYAGGKPAGTQQWVNYLYFAGRYEYEREENVAPAISDYINYGPNNETYLAEGQAIAFKIDNKAELASVQIGLKAVKGATKINIYGVEKNGDNYVFTEVFNAKEINSATELYYDITVLAGKTVVIMNAGDGEANTNPILSITNIKRTYKSEPEEEAETPKTNGIYIDTATVELALASFATVEVPAFEPDTFNVSVSKSSVKEGKTVTVTVKTSSDVDYITVNGEEVTKYKRSLFSRQRTWTYTVRANEAGEFPIDVVAYSADDIASVAVTKIINVTGTQTGGSSVGSSSSGSWLDKWFGGIFGKK